MSAPSTFSPERSRAAAAARHDFPLSSDESYTAFPNDTLFAHFPLSVYIQFAYKLRLSPDQMKAKLAGAPKWVTSDNYEIRAKASGPVTKDQLRLMMQALLADRFKLAIHFETRDSPVFALTLANPGKLGPNLHPHAEGPPCDRPSDTAFPSECYSDFVIPTHDGLFKEGMRNNSMEGIAHSLTATGRLDHPLVDQTGLSGNFDYFIEWSRAASTVSASSTGVPDPQGPTYLEALKEQLGMKIASARAPLEFLIIDHIERPSEN
jgi:bla regulator protein blaR1